MEAPEQPEDPLKWNFIFIDPNAPDEDNVP